MESIIKSLSFDWRFFLAQVVLFLFLWQVMNLLFWKPMLAHLAKRDQGIKDAYDTVDTIRHEMETLRSDYQARIVKIESEARSHIQQAIKEAQSERERILAEARSEADAAVRLGAETMEREKVDALTSLRARMVDIALGAVSKALGSTADPAAVRQFVEQRVTSPG